MSTIFKLNYKFQTKDDRDYKYTVPKAGPTMPPLFQIKYNKVYDQGALGSCVSNSFAQMLNIISNNTINLSRLFHYYNGRLLSGFSNLDDSGLYIRTACKIISSIGYNDESVWLYDVNNNTKMPPIASYLAVKKFKTYTYTFINQTVNDLKQYLFNTKSPIIFGILIYSSFFTKNVMTTGNVPTPNISIEIPIGGHCLTMIGYNDAKQIFICLNSWGCY